MATLCLHSGYILATFWLHFGYILVTFWLHSGFILATFKLYSGYILATLITADGAYHCPMGSIWLFLSSWDITLPLVIEETTNENEQANEEGAIHHPAGRGHGSSM